MRSECKMEFDHWSVEGHKLCGQLDRNIFKKTNSNAEIHLYKSHRLNWSIVSGIIWHKKNFTDTAKFYIESI